ncbi:hypothetical protein ACFVZW_13630 [Streptomyces sp. NPDC059567]|uniref:hypothetical protein n=1 Tax=Streptomyces sp. NPDC059567 TaxID=3346867 RepID=UPI0036A8FAF7
MADSTLDGGPPAAPPRGVAGSVGGRAGSHPPPGPPAGPGHTRAVAVLREGDGDVRGVPDGFSYEITVDGETVRCGDPRLTDSQRALIARVLKEGA